MTYFFPKPRFLTLFGRGTFSGGGTLFSIDRGADTDMGQPWADTDMDQTGSDTDMVQPWADTDMCQPGG